MLEIKVKKELFGAEGTMLLDVDLKIKKGSFLAISGESGSGKTTLLRILAGLEKSRAKIVADKKIWQNDKVFLPPQKREIGFVFQDYALFSNMSVAENLLFVKKDLNLANRLLTLTGLASLKNRLPHTLSGGQKQRVALCRALMKRPEVLLLDEPLSALDPGMRSKLQSEISLLHKEFATTTLMVSHDPGEIYRLADSVILLEKGKVVKHSAPKDVLMKTSGSQKFSFEGELLEIVGTDAIYVAVVAVGRQISEIVVSCAEAKGLKAGDRVIVSTKAFAPWIKKI